MKNKILRKLGYVNLLHRYNIQQAGSRAGLSYGQHPILRALMNNGGSMNQKQISECAHISAPAVTNAIKRLLKQGLVEKRVSEQDMRVTIISITELGEKKMNNFKEQLGTYDEDCFAGISGEELDTFEKILDKIIVNLGGDPDDDRAFFGLFDELQKNGREEDV